LKIKVSRTNLINFDIVNDILYSNLFKPKLNDLALMSIECKKVEAMIWDEIINNFAQV